MNKQPNANTLWEKNAEWLRSSRMHMWNPDYFSFLVNQVWKINKAVKIVDFGCGIGYLGSVLLPLLPKGSTYTGLDINSILLEDARSAFADTEWEVEFIEKDLTQYIPEEKYDIAICQTLLIHLSSPVTILKKMVQSVVAGGHVICIEPNWAFTFVGVYRHGMETYMYEDWGVNQKLFDIALQRGEPDRYVGIKIPAMMHDLGLKNIDIRVNDKGTLEFKQADKTQLARDRTERRIKRFNNAEFYMNSGLNASEAEHHVENILRTEDYENNHDGLLPTVSVMSYLISYGEK